MISASLGKYRSEQERQYKFHDSTVEFELNLKQTILHISLLFTI